MITDQFSEKVNTLYAQLTMLGVGDNYFRKIQMIARETNTSEHLIADIVAARVKFDIEREQMKEAKYSDEKKTLALSGSRAMLECLHCGTLRLINALEVTREAAKACLMGHFEFAPQYQVLNEGQAQQEMVDMYNEGCSQSVMETMWQMPWTRIQDVLEAAGVDINIPRQMTTREAEALLASEFDEVAAKYSK